ncbi:MAG: hypothetical protein ACP5UI_04320 [Thermoprotei archaeon]|nr:hypothetical protein [TACK group archaeon]
MKEELHDQVDAARRLMLLLRLSVAAAQSELEKRGSVDGVKACEVTRLAVRKLEDMLGSVGTEDDLRDWLVTALVVLEELSSRSDMPRPIGQALQEVEAGLQKREAREWEAVKGCEMRCLACKELSKPPSWNSAPLTPVKVKQNSNLEGDALWTRSSDPSRRAISKRPWLLRFAKLV